MGYDLGLKVKNKHISKKFVDFINQYGSKHHFLTSLFWNDEPTYLDKRSIFFAVSYSLTNLYSTIYLYSVFYNIAIKNGLYKTINNIKVVEICYEDGIKFQLAKENPYSPEHKLFKSFISINDDNIFDYKNEKEYLILCQYFPEEKIFVDEIIQETLTFIQKINQYNFEDTI